MTTTANLIAEACDADTTSYRVDGNREWITLDRLARTEQDAKDFLHCARAYLRSSGWQACAWNEGFKFIDGEKFYTAGIDAMRGTGPRTDYENHMISTCTGRD
jgi:hypothetical protein